jgi:hypothetical protein
MFARAAAAPCAAAQFARARRETGRLARGSRSRAKSGRRASPSGVDVTPRAVSIYDKVRGEDEPPSTVPDPASVPDQVTTSTSPAEAPAAPRRARPTVRAGAPVVAPRVISSKAAMLASAEDLAGDCDADLDDACFDREADREADANDGIVSWTVKYVDKALDDIEREKPAAADVAWRLNKAGERVASNPTVRRGAKLTADVGMEVLKVGVKAAAPVVGNIGKFAAKQAFGAAVSGFKNPLDELKRPNAEKSEARASEVSSPNGEKKKKKIVKLTAAEAEALRKAGKTVRKVEKKKGGFFGM